jgi:hypothetical protein
MALVRCSKHHILYNDENPRGCPACALDHAEDDQATIVRQLVRVSKSSRAVSPGSPAAAAPEDDREEPSPSRLGTAFKYVFAYLGVWRRRVVLEIKDHPAVTVVGLVAALALALVVIRLTGPQFVAEPHPAPATGESRPLPLLPGQPVPQLFAMLGAVPPSPHPTASNMERYEFDTTLVVDAVNGVVHSISIRTAERTWQSLRVGTAMRRAEGALALLSTPTRENPGRFSTPEIRGNYQVFPSLEDRPRQLLTADVRPPNGCYDVQVVLQPHVIGMLEDDDGRFPVVGRRDAALNWVVTQIHVVSRAIAGPAANEPVC